MDFAHGELPREEVSEFTGTARERPMTALDCKSSTGATASTNAQVSRFKCGGAMGLRTRAAIAKVQSQPMFLACLA